MFSIEFFENFRNSFYTEHSWETILSKSTLILGSLWNFALILLITEAKFGDDPLEIYEISP